MRIYADKAQCPAGHTFRVSRRVHSAGKKVSTYCEQCRKTYVLLAGPAPAPAQGRLL